MPKGKSKAKRAKKGQSTALPKTLKQALSLSQAQISNMTASTQSKLMAMLNKYANRRLDVISTSLNKNNLKPSNIADSQVLKNRIKETDKGFKVVSKFSGTGKKSKAQMQEAIRETTLFLRSPVSTVGGLKKRAVAQQQTLLSLYNDMMGFEPGDVGYATRLTQQQYDDYGRILTELRKNKELVGGFFDKTYVNNMQIAAQVIMEKSHAEIDDFIHDIEENVKSEGEKKAKQKEARHALVSSFLGE